MSLRNRARQLQRASGLTYQQSLERLRALAGAPAALARANHWPLARADRFLVERGLDEEWRAAAEQGAAPVERRCAECDALFFVARGEGEARCAGCRRGRGIVDVLDVSATEIEIVCEELRVSCAALRVIVLGRDGRVRARAGETPGMAVRALAWWGVSPRVSTLESALGDGRQVLITPIGERGRLVVVFDDRTRSELVRWQAERAVELLERLLSDEDAPFGMAPPSTPSGGAGGAPAEAWVAAWWRWRRA
jgi:hypothetical protein